MGTQDEHHDAHVTSLRVLLGSILSPKRAACTRSTATSGTASPAFLPSHPGSPELAHARPHAHHPHAHAAAPSASRGTPSSPPALSRAESSASIPDHVSMPRHDGVPPHAMSADEHHRARADLMGSLQSKNTAWDALIHGSFV
ncbi:hypothetical protein PsYK624_091570 [Phanerochaete sordida]|uniref:Uncharacterized protein n=1 Tax=Phanerochaete sordida TaxID=48140 RepID=A0A9P3LFS6_9APHY|nr:hypothetical protein PsYK624_091570 [Phanerochaete sordida]